MQIRKNNNKKKKISAPALVLEKDLHFALDPQLFSSSVHHN